MKTVDILVEELPKRGGWPDDSDEMCQSQFDCEIYTNSKLLHDFYVGERAEDNGTDNVVTREQYEAALAAKNDGWIEWGGGECPVEEGALVDVKYRDGAIKKGLRALIPNSGRSASRLFWVKDNLPTDIIAYRLHQPQEAEQTEADDEADLNECIGQDAAPAWNGESLPPVGCECEYSLNGGKTWWNCKVDYIVGTQWVVMLCDTFEGVQYVQFSSYGNALKFRPTRSEAERKREKAVQALCNAGGGNGRVDEESGYGSCWFDVYDAIAAGKIPGVKLED